MTSVLWVPPGKIELPPPGSLRRRFDVGQAAVVALVAGPGAGKTLALRDLAQDARDGGAIAVWYALDAADADPATFFPTLVAAVRAHVPPFGEEVLGALASGKATPAFLWPRFLKALAAYNLPGVFLAFDDAHLLADGDGAELLRALAASFERLPPGVRVGVASRRKLPFSLARLTARGQAVALGPERLRFGAEEEAGFLAGLAGPGGVPDAWKDRAAALEGWPLGLAMLPALQAGLPKGPRGADELSAYLAEEVVATQPPDRQAFLRRFALLAPATAEAAHAVLGAPDAEAALEALEAEHLVQRLSDGASYRVPAYLADHLAAELARQAPAAEREGLHRAAAAWHQAQGEVERALPHLMAARAWPEAARACQQLFPAWAARGRQALLMRWLDTYPAEALEAEPAMAYWRGWALSRAGRNEEAATLLEHARRAFAQAGDEAGELKAVAKLASIALYAQDAKRFGQLVLRALALAPGGMPEDLADLHLIRALAAEQRGDMALMRACNQEVLDVPIGANVEVATCQAFAQLNLHNQALYGGDLATAARHAEHARAIAEAWDFTSIALFAGFLRANLHALTGDVDAAGAFIRALPPHWPDLLDWHELACAWTVVGHYHQAKGDFPEAEQALERSRAVFERAGFAEGVKVPLERQLWLAVQRKQPARAKALAQDLDVASAHNFYDLALVVPLARATHLGGDPAGAIALLDAALPELGRLEAGLHLARARLVEAAARGAMGDGAGARAALAAAGPLIEAHDLGFLRQQDTLLQEELAALEAPAAPAPARAKAKAQVSAPEGKLTLHGFGDFEIAQGGIRLDAWPRRKAKLALAALMLHRRGMTAIDLAELLADGEPGAAALTTVQVNVSALRRVLEPALAKGTDSRYVTMRDEKYMLAWELVEDCDLVAFDRAHAEGFRLREQDPVAAAALLEEAATRYRGPLLADGFFARYFEAERERYRQEAVQALLWLVGFRLGRGEESTAEQALERACALAPHDDELQLRLLDHHADRRRPERVRNVYWDYRKALKATLGLAPEPDFEQAYQAALARAGG